MGSMMSAGDAGVVPRADELALIRADDTARPGPPAGRAGGVSGVTRRGEAHTREATPGSAGGCGHGDPLLGVGDRVAGPMGWTLRIIPPGRVGVIGEEDEVQAPPVIRASDR